MTVGILGLGLIGGSMARAYALYGHTVYAAEQDDDMLCFAMLSGAVHGRLNDETIGECDLILLAVYPGGCCQYLTAHASQIRRDALVLDCCGTKQMICAHCFPLAERFGFHFIGGHPMAGTHFSGFKYSRADLFRGAPMVLVPPRYDDIVLLERVREAFVPCEFGTFSVTTAQEHDRLIAFTSQMPHIISNAFIKSPTAQAHRGFSAGSYKDMTRVAWLNPQMWAELCMDNRENLLTELEHYITSLQAYQKTLEKQDLAGLTVLLEEGRRCKEVVDG